MLSAPPSVLSDMRLPSKFAWPSPRTCPISCLAICSNSEFGNPLPKIPPESVTSMLSTNPLLSNLNSVFPAAIESP